MTRSTTAALAAPFVQEADGDYLRPDMMPLGPTVRIPPYAGRATGDLITLTWKGGPSMDGQWSARYVLAAPGDECLFHVPPSVLAAAEIYDVTVHYVLRRAGSDADEISTAAVFAVRNYPQVNPIRVIGEDGVPTLVIDHRASWFDAALPEDFTASLQADDTVVFWLRGVSNMVATTQIADASEVAILLITAENEGKPVRHRFSRRIVVANHGEDMLLHCAVVRRNGYIQHAPIEVGLRVTKEEEVLPAVRTDGLEGDVVILDEIADERGLPVSIFNQTQTENTEIHFHLGGSRTEPYPSGSGAAVDGWIPTTMLGKHADTDCYLFCTASAPGTDGSKPLARSVRRRLTIRRHASLDDLPEADPSLEQPTIDGWVSGPLDPAQHPGGPFVRARPAAKAGDIVTFVFRTRNGLLAWRESVAIDDGNMGAAIVCRVSMSFLAYSQEQYGWLYYSVKRPDGSERFSPALNVLIQGYMPRFFYFEACWMKNMENNAGVIECPPDFLPTLGVQHAVMRFDIGDRLIVTLQGHDRESSMCFDMTIDKEPENWIWIELPADLIRRNAGYGLYYRATKIRRDYIEHTPFRTLSILPFPSRRSDPSHAQARV